MRFERKIGNLATVLQPSIRNKLILAFALLLIGTAAQRQRIASFLAPSVVGSHAHGAIVLASGGRVLYDDGGSTPLAAASTQKIIVTVTALRVLGSQFRFATRLVSKPQYHSAPMLWLVGSGDPLLTRGALARGIAYLKSRGVTAVSGVGIDAQAVRTAEINATWNPNDDGDGFQAPTSGVSLDQDTVEVHVRGAAPGQKARVNIYPAGSIVRVVDAAVSGSPESPSTLTYRQQGPNAYVISGSIASSKMRRFWLPIHNMPKDMASVLRVMLLQAGIHVGNRVVIGSSGWDGMVLWEHHSIPLSPMLKRMLLESNNHIAEELLVAIARREEGVGLDRYGLRAEFAELHRLSVPTQGFVLVDGSGLSHENRVTMRGIADILLRKRRVLESLLPGSGQGTLTDDDFGAADGRLRAKTGHLDGVSALVGYIHTAQSGVLTFAFATDGSPGDPDTAFEKSLDAIAGW